MPDILTGFFVERFYQFVTKLPLPTRLQKWLFPYKKLQSRVELLAGLTAHFDCNIGEVTIQFLVLPLLSAKLTKTTVKVFVDNQCIMTIPCCEQRPFRYGKKVDFRMPYPLSDAAIRIIRHDERSVILVGINLTLEVNHFTTVDVPLGGETKTSIYPPL